MGRMNPSKLQAVDAASTRARTEKVLIGWARTAVRD